MIKIISNLKEPSKIFRDLEQGDLFINQIDKNIYIKMNSFYTEANSLCLTTMKTYIVEKTIPVVLLKGTLTVEEADDN